MQTPDQAAICRLTDSGIASFILACPTLELLSLYWNLNVGLQTTTALSKAGMRLTCLNLSGCKAITDPDIEHVAAACTSLRQLDLTRCTPFSINRMQTAVSRQQHLALVLLQAPSFTLHVGLHTICC